MIEKYNIDFLIFSPTFEELIEMRKSLPNANLDLIYRSESTSIIYDKSIIELAYQKFSLNTKKKGITL